DQNNGHAGERADVMESERPRSSYQSRLTEILWIKARDAPRSRASVRLPEEQCMSFRLGLALMDEQTIQDFWQNHACGDALVGGLAARCGGAYAQFFADYDQFRFSLEGHLPACFDALNLAGKRVLEIGLGQGADSESLIRRGADWTGIDLTAESVERVRTRLKVRNL